MQMYHLNQLYYHLNHDLLKNGGLKRNLLKSKNVLKKRKLEVRRAGWGLNNNPRNSVLMKKRVVRSSQRPVLQFNKQLYKGPNNKYNSRYNSNRSKFSSRKQFNFRRRYRKYNKLYRWYRCKKPYWRRKSYKYIKFYSFLVNNYYKFTYNRSILLKRSRDLFHQTWKDYYRRKKIKFWFKQKILLRAGWMDRYHHWTHRKLYNTTRKFRKKHSVLSKFLHKYEFTLDRYIFIWNIKPKYIKNIYQCRYFIKSGFVRVNFVTVTAYQYAVKTGDCIFFFNMNYKKINYFALLKLMNPYKARFRRGYRLKQFWQLKKRRGFPESRKLVKSLLFLRKYKLLNYLSHNYMDYFNAYYYYFERSFKYKIFINLEVISWFIWLFSTFFLPTQVQIKISDLYINRRYYG